ncbi:hypothetical protein ABB37_06494 [Leptomonas pyrrhocoris]|uniref:Uncharacterized protein n=1 Tax=Leptomonas pyrrhocoris TaxID=157538 RepID=A0A0M9FY81_LEPPY|nr:hypothetical protein ABB37_06494 [Leptomonas pyrrhocoris]KPA78377.1 hypothetical protein ABB37_06494 [Leptomonas pyrrhocoris]|eukprot:XP_015656816.1 hypothetical protein ABB37_06494 [Leptomonas pyrrhocoris]
MKDRDRKDHYGDPARPPATKEQTLELLAGLLASTLDEQASIADVQRALSNTSGDDDAWRVRVAECVQARRSDDDTAAEPSATAAAAMQEWVCPMCETVNWAPDARKSLRRRQDDSASASLSSAQLRCACCGYGGAIEEEVDEAEHEN